MEGSDLLFARGVKTAFLADFLGRQSGGENAIQRGSIFIGERGVKQGAEVSLTVLKTRRQDADKNGKIRI